MTTGAIGEVVSVRNVNDVVRVMTEGEAFEFITQVRAIYGAKWRTFYYQADVIVSRSVVTVEPKQVLEVLDPP